MYVCTVYVCMYVKVRRCVVRYCKYGMDDDWMDGLPFHVQLQITGSMEAMSGIMNHELRRVFVGLESNPRL